MSHSSLVFVFLPLFAVGASHCAPAAGGSFDGPPSPDASTPGSVSALVDRGCVGCHDGARGGLAGGDSPVPGTRAFAPNLTPDPDTGLGQWSDEQIARAIREGLDDQGEPLCETMPRFGEMDDAEIRRIIAELRALAPVQHQAPPSECAPEHEEGTPTR